MARTSNMEEKPKRVLLYGASGSGKTTLAGTFPNPVFIDLDDGMESLSDKDVEYYTISDRETTDPDAVEILGPKLVKANGYLKTVEIIEHFLNTLGPSDTLVIDSLTIFSDYAMRHVLGLAGQKTPRIQDWGAGQGLVEGCVSAFRGSACNIIVIAHEEFTKDDESGIISWLPLTIGKLRTKLPLYFDEVYYCSAKKAKGKDASVPTIFSIETSPTRRVTAKSRFKLVGNIEFPTYNNLYNKKEK